MKLNLVIAFSAVTGLALVGCSSPKQPDPIKAPAAASKVATLGSDIQADHYSVVLNLEPKEVKPGITKLIATVRHHDKIANDAKVEVGLSMPGMGMGGPTVVLKHVGNGVYEAATELSMGGEWQAKVSISNPEGHSNVFVYKFVALQE